MTNQPDDEIDEATEARNLRAGLAEAAQLAGDDSTADRLADHDDAQAEATAAADLANLTRIVNSPIVRAPRAVLLDQLGEHYGTEVFGTASPPNWLLVEQNIRDSEYYLTLHTSAEGAVRYHREQEDAAGWRVVELVDLVGQHRHTGEGHPAWGAYEGTGADQTAGIVTGDGQHRRGVPIGLDGLPSADPACTHGGDCPIHQRPGLGLHNFDAAPPAHLTATDIAGPGDRALAAYTLMTGHTPAQPIAAKKLRDLLDQLLRAHEAAPEFDAGTEALIAEIVLRYARHEQPLAPSSDDLADMLDTVDDEEGPARAGERDYTAGWHEAVEAIRDLIDRYPDGRLTPHRDAGKPFDAGPEHGGVLAGYVVGWCGHRVLRSDWQAGFRVCERDDKAQYRDPTDRPRELYRIATVDVAAQAREMYGDAAADLLEPGTALADHDWRFEITTPTGARACLHGEATAAYAAEYIERDRAEAKPHERHFTGPGELEKSGYLVRDETTDATE
jgi:hypothetical protein